MPVCTTASSHLSLLDALCKSGRLIDARHLFDQIPHPNTQTWNTMIAAYARSTHARDALLLFARMHAQGFPPNPYSLTAALRACSDHSIRFAEQAHAQALKSSLSLPVAAGLVDVYSKIGRLASASLVFDSVSAADRVNPVLWSVMVAGHTQTGDFIGAMERFRQMRAEGVSPNRFTLPSVASACAAEAALRLGRQVHGCAVRTGFDTCTFMQSSLVGMYAKCIDVGSAKRVVELSNSEDSVPWNTLIGSCARKGHIGDALYLFVEMHRRGLEMDEFTFPSGLNLAAADGNMGFGEVVHCMILKCGFESHTHVGNALVDMYAKCKSFGCARKVFDHMPQRDVVSWTALLTGLAHNASHEGALRVYCEMRASGLELDEFVVAGVLSSCAGLAMLALGCQVHATSLTRRLESFISVGNSLVTMYAKCGCEEEARRQFDEMEGRRDAITWTALIVGYAQNGRGRDSLLVYGRMVGVGCRPDYVTFIGVLFACSHAGLVEDGRAHFESMERVHRVVPGPEHYACMIDLLGRSGRTGEAAALLGKMKAEPDATVWKALLAACRVHQDVELAERAAERLFELEPTNAVPYLLLANLYTTARRWNKVARVRGLMRSRGVSKEPGCSWVEAGGVIHVFHVEDRRHPRGEEVYAKLEEMMGRIRAVGYVADTGWSLQDVGEEGKEQGLAYHSEKLAVAFGLLTLPDGAPVRVYKNLRACGDCHTAIKLVAMVYGREIVLRDSNCFHHFSAKGRCSCGEYW